jgi:hypothetical protein
MKRNQLNAWEALVILALIALNAWVIYWIYNRGHYITLEIVTLVVTGYCVYRITKHENE